MWGYTLAKTFQLCCSGMRNWLGQIFLLRNETWPNGTVPARCVSFAGINLDVKSNDRLPVVAATHEQLCKHNCVRKHASKKSTRNTQRTQSFVAVCFGGYLSKQQHAGSLRTTQCVNKLFTLRAKLAGKVQVQQSPPATVPKDLPVAQKFINQSFAIIQAKPRK